MLPLVFPIARAVNLRVRSFGQSTKRVRFPSRRAVGDTVPSPPTNLSATVNPGDPNEFELDWDVPLSDGGDPITSYNIYTNDGGGWTLLTDTVTTSSTQSFLVTTDIRVTAVNSIGESSPSSPVTATIDDPASASGMFGSMWGAMFGRMWGRNQS